MRFVSVSQSHLGLHRLQNEDSIYACDEDGLYIVCDGMGGHQKGEVASTLALEVATRFFKDTPLDKRAKPSALQRIAQNAAQAANAAVINLAEETPSIRRMGSTMSLLKFIGARAVIAHVGDSRIYRLRAHEEELLTEDHIGWQEIVKAGVMKEAAAKKTPFANVLSRAIGIAPTVIADTKVFYVLPGDRFLLCSDGLSRYFSDAEAPEELRGDLNSSASRLIDRAIQSGGRDNISAIVVEATGTPVWLQAGSGHSLRGFLSAAKAKLLPTHQVG